MTNKYIPTSNVSLIRTIGEQGADLSVSLKYIIRACYSFGWSDFNDQSVNIQLDLNDKKKSRRETTDRIAKLITTILHVRTIRSDSRPEIWIYKEGIYVPDGETYVRELLRLILVENFNSSVTVEVIDKIMVDSYIDSKEFFDAEPVKTICLNNGLLDLDTMTVSDHSPDFFHFTKIPVDYNPDATCPHIISFFNSILKNPEQDVLLMQEITGWFLYKDYNPEKAVMLHGSGRNGKGKTLRLWETFLGVGNYCNVGLHELDPSNNQWAVSYLHKKLANFGGDLSGTSFSDSSIFKQATGRDTLKAERKHRDPIEFRNYAKMIFACNTLPRVYEDVKGFWSRWIYLDFPYHFESKEDFDSVKDVDPFVRLRDNNIIDKLTSPSELSGMLNWAIIGLKRLLTKGDFTYSPTQDDVRITWLRKSDSFAAFCMDHVVSDWSGVVVTKEELRRSYSVYCKNLGLSQVSDKAIKSYLSKEFGSTESRKSSVVTSGERFTVWSGVRFGVERDHPDSVFSWSVLGYEIRDDVPSRVLSFIRRRSSSSVEQLVREDEIYREFVGVDVYNVLKLLSDRGDIFSPRVASWRVLE